MNWIERTLRSARQSHPTTLDLSVRAVGNGNPKPSDILNSIPREVFSFTELRELNLSGHHITGLPIALRSLGNLRRLILSGSESIQFPKIEFPELEYLELRYAHVQGDINLGYFPKLKCFDGTHSRFERIEGPAPALESLRLRYANFTGYPTELLKSPQLTDAEIGTESEDPSPYLKSLNAAIIRSLALSYANDHVTNLIGYFPNLEAITVDVSDLSRIPERWRDLRLRHLSLTGSMRGASIDNLSIIAELTELAVLRLSGLADVSPAMLSNLQRVTELSIQYVPLFRFPLELAKLPSLRRLTLADCGIPSIPQTIEYFENLTHLDLSSNHFTSLPFALARIKALQKLCLSNTGLEKLPPDLEKLQCMRHITLSDNPLGSWPKVLNAFQELVVLQMERCNLTQIPQNAAALKKLQVLSLSENRLSEIPIEVLTLPALRQIDIDGNPISSPPPEIVARGTVAIQDYFSALGRTETISLFEAKLIIVGEGEVGKTCIARKLTNDDFDIILNSRNIESTRGVGISRWECNTAKAPDFRVNIWDFGGQEIYHATHQFFLTKRSLYLFIWDARREDRSGGFDYWLSAVSLLSNQSPIIVVLNKVDVRIKEVDQNTIQFRFPNVIAFHKVSALTGRGFRDLREEIQRALADLPHVGDPWPVSWSNVRMRLEQDDRDYLILTDYYHICEEEGIGMPEAETLGGYLHDLGVTLHFLEDPLLRNIVILKPEWGTNAVYAVLDAPAVIENRGRFSLSDLRGIWTAAGYSVERHDELLQLMMRFELCFRLGSGHDYIAPELLEVKPPNFAWDAVENLVFEYQYDFMPAGILTRFIARKHMLISGSCYWKDGVVLQWESTFALITSDRFRKTIRICLKGENTQGLLSIIRQEFAEIHKTLNHPVFNQMISCCCDQCRRTSPFLFDYGRVKRFRSHGKEVITCEKSFVEVPIVAILLGTFGEGKDVEGSRGVRVTVSNRLAGSVYEHQEPRWNPWLSGSFYLVAFLAVTGVGVIAMRFADPVAVASVLALSIVALAAIGALQLKQDARYSDESFLALMRLALNKLEVPSLSPQQRRDRSQHRVGPASGGTEIGE